MKSFIKTIMSSTLVLILLLTNIAQVSAYHVLAKSSQTNTYSRTASAATRATTQAIDASGINSRSSDTQIIIQWKEIANRDHVYSVIRKEDEGLTTSITWAKAPSSRVLNLDANNEYILMQKHRDLPDEAANIQTHVFTAGASPAGTVTGAGTVKDGNTMTIGTTLTAQKDGAAVPGDSLFLWTYEDGTPVSTTANHIISVGDLGKRLKLYISGTSTEKGLLEATFDGTSTVSAVITKRPSTVANRVIYARYVDSLEFGSWDAHQVAITDTTVTDSSVIPDDKWTDISRNTTLYKDYKGGALVEDTGYKLWARVLETDSALASPVTVTDVRTAKTIEDTLAITGEAKFGVELNPSIDGSKYAPGSSVLYKWYRIKNGVETEIKSGSTGADRKYTPVAEDVGAQIKLSMTVTPGLSYGSVDREGVRGVMEATTAVVARGDAPAKPASAPKVSKATHERIVLTTIPGSEYAISEGQEAADANTLTYQSNPTFTRLKPQTDYFLYHRVAESEATLAGLASDSVRGRTGVVPTEQISGHVEFGGFGTAFGLVLSADVGALTINGKRPNSDKFLYTWEIDGVEVSTNKSYSPVVEDIGKEIKLTIGHEDASNTIVLTSTVTKTPQVTPNLAVDAGIVGFVAIKNVATNINTTPEYAITKNDANGPVEPTDDEYQESNIFESADLEAGEYTIYARYVGSETHQPSQVATRSITIAQQDQGEILGDITFKDKTTALGGTLEADASGITAPATAAERIIIWRRDGVLVNIVIGAGSANIYRYNITGADLGAVISAEVRASKHTGVKTVFSDRVPKNDYTLFVEVPVATATSSSSITFTAVEGYEYLATTEDLTEAEAATKTFSENNVISGLSADTSYNIYQRAAETQTVKPSDVKKGIPVKTLSTSGGGPGDGGTGGGPGGDGGTGGGGSGDGGTGGGGSGGGGTGGGSGSGGGSSSSGGSGTTTPSTGSVTHNTTIGSALSKLNDAKAGDVLSIDMGSVTAIDGKLLQALKDKGVDAILKYGTYTWTIKAADIKSVSDSSLSIDLKVTTDKKSEVSELVGGKDIVQLDIAHNGSFPFKATLEIAADSKYNGQTLYVAYVDGSTLEYKEMAPVSNGKMKASFDGASTYIATEDVSKGSSVKFSVDTSEATIVPKYTNGAGESIVVKQSAIKDGKLVFKAPETAKYTISNVGVSYTDVSGNHWALPNIQFVSAREICKGSGEGKFSPEKNMTRAEVVTTLGRLFGVEGTHSSSFNDVGADAYYSNYVGWAANSGIVQGVGGNKFNPNGQITREELAVILIKYIGASKMALTATSAGMIFDDASSISSWAAESVSQAVSLGLINGKPGNKFDPKGVATRAEVSTVIARLISEGAGQ